jgi:hypothetical protein
MVSHEILIFDIKYVILNELVILEQFMLLIYKISDLVNAIIAGS